MASGRLKLDKMWRIWYAVLVVLLQAFLLYSSAVRYSVHRVQALRESWETGPMNFCLAALIGTSCLLLLFVYAAFARTGNYAEDGVSLGRDHRHLKAAIATVGPDTGNGGGGGVSSISASGIQSPASLGDFAGRLRRNFLPFSCVLHLLMAGCLLFPVPVLDASCLLHEKLPAETAWSSDLDFLIRPSLQSSNPISAEVFNLALALSILLVRYPSVFWYTNRLFAFLISVVLCAASIHILLAYEATSMLYKAAVAEPATAVEVGLSPAALLSLLAIGDLLLLVSVTAYFEFGYAQVLTSIRRYRHLLAAESASSCCGSDRSCSSCAAAADEEAGPCWLTHAPHLSGGLLTLAAVLCKAPLLWAWISVYRTRRHPLLLLATLSAATYAAVWLAVWLVLCLRYRWRFRVRLDSAGASGGDSMRPAMVATVGGSKRGSRSGSQLSDSEALNRSNQYMYMQRLADCPAGLIPTISEHVDNVSEGSYSRVGNGGGSGGTLDRDRQSGLGKYQVRRNSAQMTGSQAGSLRRGPGRVTFKDPQHQEMHSHEQHQQQQQQPSSPGSSQNTSSDSGVGGHNHHLHCGVPDEYAQVARAARQCTYDEYQMFADGRRGEFFQEPPYAIHSDVYNNRVPILPPPPTHIGGGVGIEASAAGPAVMASSASSVVGTTGGVSTFGRSAAPAATLVVSSHLHQHHQHHQQDGEHVPDILINRSPYGSLARPAKQPVGSVASAAAAVAAAAAAARHLGAVGELHTHGGSFGSLPPPPPELDQQHVDGLCSQV